MRIPIASTLLATALLGGCSQPTAPAETIDPPAPVTLEIALPDGTIRGVTNGTDAAAVKQYHGIPYAAAPVGDLRWAPPAPVAQWDEVRDAGQPEPACVQPEGNADSFYGQSGFAQSEDCLTLNVWTRATTEAQTLPVMVWIHGGGLVTGSGSNYPGELLTRKGVVLVTVNYRLGRFGFFAHPALTAEHRRGVSGNQGLRDQIAALEWVQRHIGKFGGDPDNVTIFGESAGALSVSLLQASPLARGLFHRVIAESGGAFQPMWHRAEEKTYAPAAETHGEQFAAALTKGETRRCCFANVDVAKTQGVANGPHHVGRRGQPRLFQLRLARHRRW